MISFFVWAVLPSGGLLTAMLLSGNKICMYVASKALSTPIRLGSFRLSFAVVASALAGILTLLFYATLRRHEARVLSAQGTTAEALGLRDQLQLKAAFAGRNFYICLLGLVLWTSAWRLKVLYDQERLHSAAKAVVRRALPVRMFCYAVCLGALLATDIPLCRLNYNLQLYLYVTPRKVELQKQAKQCAAAYYNVAADGACAKFCKDTEELALERQTIIHWARDWHFLGRYSARFFDGVRGVTQDEKKLEELFKKKTCAQVLSSVDKGNEKVNFFCAFAAVAGVVVALTALSNASPGGGLVQHSNEHQD